MEGTTTVTYFAEDNADNVEVAKTLVVRIDRTPPDFEVRFDPERLDIAVFGVDVLSSVAAGPVRPSSRDHFSRRRYEIVDLAGNRLNVVIAVQPQGGHERSSGEHRLEATVVSWRDDDYVVKRPAPNELEFVWTTDKGGVLRHLKQEGSLQSAVRHRIVEARFDAKRGVTTIRDGRKDPIERPGLVLMRLITTRGQLSIQY